MNIINTIIVILAVLIILAVTIQSKGTGLSIIPNSNDFGKFERRGPEEILHQGTIGLIAIFIVLTIFSYFLA
jgi:protein translocase SecG subunit